MTRTADLPTDLESALALLKAREDELEALEEYTSGGREFYPDGTERPTTILERVKTLNLCLAAESQGGDEARDSLGDARRHVQEYRRCIRVALDEQREAPDVGVLMTDLEDLLDQMAEQSDLSRDPDQEPEFTFEAVGPTTITLLDAAESGTSLWLNNLRTEPVILVGLIEGTVELDRYVPVLVESVRVEGPAELNKDPPTVWKKT